SAKPSLRRELNARRSAKPRDRNRNASEPGKLRWPWRLRRRPSVLLRNKPHLRRPRRQNSKQPLKPSRRQNVTLDMPHGKLQKKSGAGAIEPESSVYRRIIGTRTLWPIRGFARSHPQRAPPKIRL